LTFSWFPSLLFLRAGPMWASLSRNRYKHIHVRLTPAIPGLRHSGKGMPTPVRSSWQWYPLSRTWNRQAWRKA